MFQLLPRKTPPPQGMISNWTENDVVSIFGLSSFAYFSNFKAFAPRKDIRWRRSVHVLLRNKKRSDLSNYLQKSQSRENIREPTFLMIVKGVQMSFTLIVYHIIAQIEFVLAFSLFRPRALMAMQGSHKSESKEITQRVVKVV